MSLSRGNSPQRIQKIIYIVVEGYAGGRPSNNARRRHAKEVLTILIRVRTNITKHRAPPLLFDERDTLTLILNHNDSLLVKAYVNHKEIHGLLIDI